MNHSLITSAVSMRSLQQRIDMIGHNMANLNTVGYKRKEATFQDILTTQKQQLDDMALPGRLTPLGLTEGWGTRLSRQLVDFTQGSILQTDQPTDFALEGNALFELATPRLDADGQPVLNAAGELEYDSAWTRAGAFQLVELPWDMENTYLTTADGMFVLDVDGNRIAIPNQHRLVVDAEGRITAYSPEDEAIEIGQMRIVKVLQPQQLVSVGDQRFGIAENMDRDAVLMVLNDAAMVAQEEVGIRQGALEQSNVSMIDEMTELISIQRSYQLSARALSSADTMMNLANNLRGT